MNIKSWLIRTYLKFRFLRDKKQAPQELMVENESENVINLETDASDETWLQRYISLGK